MSTFSKKYYSPKDSNKYLAVTWETGYRNIQIYFNQRIVHTIKHPGPLEDGIKINDDELGKIKFVFSTQRPRVLEIKVNNRKYKTVNKLKMSYDYAGLIAVFSTLAVMAGIENFIFGGIYGFDFAYPEFTLIFIVDVLFLASYVVTSYLLRKKKPWAYFIGTSLFLLTTLASTAGFSLIFSPSWNMMMLVFRYGILIFLLLQVKNIIKEMKKSERPNQNEDVLDDFL